MSGVVMAGPVAYLSESQAAVFFSKSSASAGTFQPNTVTGTVVPVRKMQTALEVAMWGEDNRFPQNIQAQMDYCGLGKEALNWKARALFGNGIIPGKITGHDDKGNDIFTPLNRTKYKAQYAFIESPAYFRYKLEFLQDWTWFGNCFPEMVLSKDAKTITGLVHQESCDARYKQMNDDGEIDTVYLSKLWGAAKNQYAQFDPKKRIKGIIENPQELDKVDGKLVQALDCIDMYNPAESLQAIAEKQVQEKGLGAFKSAILPVNFPSVNKTYYQVPSWDGARLSGWVEIACKQPVLLKALIDKAYRIRYHIKIPETYFQKKYGIEGWEAMTEPQQEAARKKLLEDMDAFLSGTENAYKSFISFFDYDTVAKKEYGEVKIEEIPATSTIDKDLLLGSAAGVEILIAMGVDPTLFGAGAGGSLYRSGGGSGSDKREAYLIYCAGLLLERQVMLAPLHLVRDYNRIVGGIEEWEEDIVFRFRDTVLTTLDQGKGTEKKLS